VADFYATFDGNSSYRAHLVIVQTSQDQAGNYSNVYGSEYVERTAGSGYATSATGNYGGISGDLTVPGDGWAPYDFTLYTQKLIGQGTGQVFHNSDGTKTATGAFGASDAHGGNFGFASGPWALGLTPIPRTGKRWNGSAWVPLTIAKRYNGSAWVDLTAKRYNGSSWVVTS